MRLRKSISVKNLSQLGLIHIAHVKKLIFPPIFRKMVPSSFILSLLSDLSPTKFLPSSSRCTAGILHYYGNFQGRSLEGGRKERQRSGVKSFWKAITKLRSCSMITGSLSLYRVEPVIETQSVTVTPSGNGKSVTLTNCHCK